jgi:hypothetical protein
MGELPLTKSKRSTRVSRIRIRAPGRRGCLGIRKDKNANGVVYSFGPRSAWSVVPLIGANRLFVANPARFLIVMLAILPWEARNDAVKLSSERSSNHL